MYVHHPKGYGEIDAVSPGRHRVPVKVYGVLQVAAISDRELAPIACSRHLTDQVVGEIEPGNKDESFSEMDANIAAAGITLYRVPILCG